MKKNNPNTPILLRDAQGTLPKIYARYDLGRETSKPLQGKSPVAVVLSGLGERSVPLLMRCVGLSDKQIEDVVAGLVKGEA